MIWTHNARAAASESPASAVDPELDPEVEPELEPPLDPELEPPFDPELEPPFDPELEPPFDPELPPPLDPELPPPLDPELPPPLDPELPPPIDPELPPPPLLLPPGLLPLEPPPLPDGGVAGAPSGSVQPVLSPPPPSQPRPSAKTATPTSANCVIRLFVQTFIGRRASLSPKACIAPRPDTRKKRPQFCEYRWECCLAIWLRVRFPDRCESPGARARNRGKSRPRWSRCARPER
jgi:hypothetical protein